MATISAVRDALLATAITPIDKLRGYDTIPDSINVPAAVVIPDRGVPLTNARGFDTHQYRIRLVVGRVSERTAQDLLDSYLSSSGDKSIRALIHATPGLGIAGTHARWEGWENYGEVLWNEQSYLGADVLVTVETKGTA